MNSSLKKTSVKPRGRDYGENISLSQKTPLGFNLYLPFRITSDCKYQWLKYETTIIYINHKHYSNW